MRPTHENIGHITSTTCQKLITFTSCVRASYTFCQQIYVKLQIFYILINSYSLCLQCITLFRNILNKVQIMGYARQHSVQDYITSHEELIYGFHKQAKDSSVRSFQISFICFARLGLYSYYYWCIS